MIASVARAFCFLLVLTDATMLLHAHRTLWQPFGLRMDLMQRNYLSSVVSIRLYGVPLFCTHRSLFHARGDGVLRDTPPLLSGNADLPRETMLKNSIWKYTEV